MLGWEACQARPVAAFFLEFKPIREQNYAFFLCAPKFTLHKRTNFLHSGYKW